MGTVYNTVRFRSFLGYSGFVAAFLLMNTVVFFLQLSASLPLYLKESRKRSNKQTSMQAKQDSQNILALWSCVAFLLLNGICFLTCSAFCLTLRLSAVSAKTSAM